MMKHASFLEDDSSMNDSTLSVHLETPLCLVETSVRSLDQRSQVDIDHQSMMDSYVHETSVLGFFERDTGGGPTPVFSVCAGALSLMSQVTRHSVFSEMHVLSQELDLSPQDLEVIDSSSESSGEDFVDVDLEIWRKLRSWSLDHHASRDAMSDLLLIFIDIGHESWPRDWRTVLSRLNRYDEESSDQFFAHHATVTHVCGSCFLVPFPDDVVSTAPAGLSCM